MQGWIKLHRCLLEKPIWVESTPQQKTILITLMMMANHQGKEWEWKGEKYQASPGQFVTSLDSIVKKCGKGISVQNVRTALLRFEKYEFLTSESTNKNRLITIVNWGFYQGIDDETNKQTDRQLTSNQQATNKQLTTNKNVKNEKNERNNYSVEFEEFWSIYPRRKEKSKAFTCWNARLKENGVTSELLILCAKNYSDEVKREGTIEKFMKHPATFLGPNKPYEDYQKISTSKKTPTYEVDNQQVSDAALEAWVKNNANQRHG